MLPRCRVGDARRHEPASAIPPRRRRAPRGAPSEHGRGERRRLPEGWTRGGCGTNGGSSAKSPVLTVAPHPRGRCDPSPELVEASGDIDATSAGKYGHSDLTARCEVLNSRGAGARPPDAGDFGYAESEDGARPNCPPPRPRGGRPGRLPCRQPRPQLLSNRPRPRFRCPPDIACRIRRRRALMPSAAG